MASQNKLRTYDVKKRGSEKKNRIWRLFLCNRMPSTNRNARCTPYLNIFIWATILYKNHAQSIHSQAFQQRFGSGSTFIVQVGRIPIWQHEIEIKMYYQAKNVTKIYVVIIYCNYLDIIRLNIIRTFKRKVIKKIIKQNEYWFLFIHLLCMTDTI